MIEHLQKKTPIRKSDIGLTLAALLFLRWADFEDAEREAIAAFEDLNYEPVVPDHCRWRNWCDSSPEQLADVFGEMPFILGRLTNRRDDPLATQLSRAASGLEPLQVLDGEALSILVRWLANQPFETPSDRLKLRDLLDQVLAKTSGREANQHSSPPLLTKLMAGLAEPKFGESAYDPCFGSAGLLTAALEHVGDHGRKTADEQSYQSGAQPLRIAGVESKPHAYLIGLTRLVLSGVIDPKLELGNSLERVPVSNPGTEGFDIVLANPPWGGKVDLHGLDHLPIQLNDSTSLFIQHALSQLRPDGRAVIAVPASVLFRSGRGVELREWLLLENTLEAVVAMPPSLLASHSSVDFSLLVLRRGGTTRTVRMVNPTKFFQKAGFPKAKSNLPEMLPELFLSSMTEMLIRNPEKYDRGSDETWDVDIETLRATSYDLTPRRRDQSGLQQILDSLPDDVRITTLDECCDVRGGRNIRSADLLADANATYLTVGQSASLLAVDSEVVVELREKGELQGFRDGASWKLPRKQVEELARERGVDQRLDAMVPYVRIGDVSKGVAASGSSFVDPAHAEQLKPEWKLRSGDLLLSKSGTIGKAGIVRNGAVGAIASSGFFVLRPNAGQLDPHFLLAYLQSAEANAWFDDHARGSAARHLAIGVVRTLPVPVPPLQIQQRVAEECRKFGVDALTYLAELVSEDQSDALPTELSEWVVLNLRIVDSMEQSDKLASFLEDVESIARSRFPIKLCESCDRHYVPDYSDEIHIEGPVNYAAGIEKMCLGCWLDVGSSAEGIEELTKQSPLVPWAIVFQMAVDPLERVTAIPDTAAIYSLLQSTKIGLGAALDKIQGSLPNEQRARELTEELSSRITWHLSNLISAVKLVVDVVDASFVDRETMKVSVRITNAGKLPLHDLDFEFKPPLTPKQGSRFPFVGPGSSIEIDFSGSNQWYSDDQLTALQWTSPDVVLSWSGRTIAGTSFREARELAIDFDAPSVNDAVDQSELTTRSGGSPYICGDPVKPERGEVFFGREELLKQIRRMVIDSGNVVLLEGNRRAGKSSVLWHLEGTTAIPGWMGVYCSLQGAEGDSKGGIPTADVFRAIAYELVQSVRKLNGSAVLPDGTILDENRKMGISRSLRKGISDDAPFQDFREYVEMILDALSSQNLGILLMLDEFDKLQEGIDKGVTSPQVPENIRFLVQSLPRFSAILTGSRRLKRMREEYWSALFGLGTRLGVSSLPKPAASRLIVEPVKGQLAFATPAVDRCYELTAGQPYLLQCLCNRIFDIAAQSKLRSITIDHVDQAAEALVEDNEHFASLWDYTECDRRRFLLIVLWQERNGSDPMRLGAIQAKLEQAGVEVREETLMEDLEYLRELELIDLNSESGGASYTLAIPMMGQWLDLQQDYEVLRSRARGDVESALTESPYQTGNPLRSGSEELFVGRNETLDTIAQLLSNGHRLLMLEGPRRIGKTSILFQLQQSPSLVDWVPAYCGIHWPDELEPTESIAYSIVSTVLNFVDTFELPDGKTINRGKAIGHQKAVRSAMGDGNINLNFQQLVERAVAVFENEGKRLLLTLDDVRLAEDKESIGGRNVCFLRSLESMTRKLDGFAVLFVGDGVREGDSDSQINALLKSVSRIKLGRLSSKVASGLLSEPAQGVFKYDAAALELAVQSSGGEPYLLQLLGNQIFENAIKNKLNRVQLFHVENAIDELCEQTQFFENTWKSLGSNNSRFILALIWNECKKANPAVLVDIKARYEQLGIEVPAAGLLADILMLYEDGIVEMSDNEHSVASFKLAVPMVGRWIDKHQDKDILRSMAAAEVNDEFRNSQQNSVADLKNLLETDDND
ncbi:putative type I restriction enzymeP M protein [Planctomycetes bacterium CA13]|uniref:site-specific DNA-methyltransferase (adenine-specific) n=1 Tax=Novipirellula herctigrandis TaxID=2527986 RepID=A0A5C5YZU9_9BACT|nr:putative type I restriction enzymeP M protein [Planctomycetes bacterium CA13]